MKVSCRTRDAKGERGLLPFLQDLSRQVAPLMDENHNDFELRLLGSPPHLDADPLRVQQIMLNLIGNAAKFTHGGVITLTVERCTGHGPWAEDILFHLDDTGIGIPPDQINEIFDEFTQGDGSMTRRYGGTGLGLAISRRLARLMDGDLSVTSQVEKGSRFTLRLPRRNPRRKPPSETPFPAQTITGSRPAPTQ